jgi:hypothetical protein
VAGRNADEAIRDYKTGLTSAFNCLKCYSKLEFTAPRRARGGDPCSWILVGPGSDEGIQLPGIGGRLEASQRLRIVEREGQPRESKFGLTTTGYDYSMTDADGRELWCMHWHPETPNSDIAYPHIHLRQLFGGAHLATGRLLVEHAIHWAIEAGATWRYEDWHERLRETIKKHEQERQWS